ncbi:lysine transporter LysE [Maribacter sp. MJ134]|uniref:LysE family translocator n=1 Tax=Maribacter sp. MJ134 TaxID=2496865 RepID=UPI000F83673B|nr:LysE family transporter [Maribacter sp. MJ134]AZQ58147.1 lysine transporter LysE [Maribacter sp. MJ134]
MVFFTCLFFGFIIAASGSISPSFLNLTVVKFSLKSGRKSALYLIGGFATVLFFQANIGAYFASVLMKNSEYITIIQMIGTGILILLSLNFFRLHFKSKGQLKKVEIEKSKAYIHGIGMSLLNTFAIPFYFTTISFLIGLDYFEYSLFNSFYFSIGSTIGSFTIYAVYATVASRIEDRLTTAATKMNFIIGCLTGVVGLGNLFYLL